MPRGSEYKIPLTELLAAAEHHQRGWSLRAICRMKWRQWGYASQNSALEGLRHALRTIDVPVRDRIEASVMASVMHGNSTTAARQPGHPGHARFLAHKRAMRRTKGWK